MLVPLFSHELYTQFFFQRNAVAVAHCKAGKGVIKINGCPVHLVEPEVLRVKVLEPILLLGKDRFAALDVRVRVKGGGQVAQIFGTCCASAATRAGGLPAGLLGPAA